ncbi:hypothetical protein C8F01DRAFT_1232362 [Mycena amicta]|nr:hypothetical protein C8F01DRAFT_1232362 [Mycena amicta]
MVLHALLQVPLQHDKDLPGDVLRLSLILLPALSGHRGPELFTEALRAGFLFVLFQLASLSAVFVPTCADGISKLLEVGLDAEFPALTVYHPVVAQLRKSLPTVDGLDADRHFCYPALIPMWCRFIGLARERVAVLQVSSSGNSTIGRRCDNPECFHICARKQMRRCSGCQTTLYCSTPCQAKDWDAGHRRGCFVIRGRQKDEYSGDQPERIHSFLHALMAYERQTKAEEIKSMLSQHFAQRHLDICDTPPDYISPYYPTATAPFLPGVFSPSP